MPPSAKTTFHDALDVNRYLGGRYVYSQDTEFTYTFENFFHPYVGELIAKLNKESLAGLLDPNFHKALATPFFEDFYTALNSNVVAFDPFPKKEIDLNDDGPYANYNWELLFHIPLTIAVHLSKNQRFAEAQRWFHLIFDPGSPDKVWKFLAFSNNDQPHPIEELLALLSTPDDELKYGERERKADLLHGHY